MTKRLIIFCKYWFVYAYWMLPIVRSVWMNVHLIGGVVHHPKPPSMWKEGDRLRWGIENSVACESTLHTRSHPCTALPISWICMCVPYVVLSYQSARPAGDHPPLTRSPLFQGKRAFLPFLRNKKIPPPQRGGILDIGFSVFTYRYSLL